jgi:ankyrin repeat protein
MQQLYDEALETSTLASQSDSSVQGDESTNCLLVPNDMGYTPLVLAIYAHAGWEVIESLLCDQCDINSLDSENNNALHLLVSEQYKDPAAALAVLRAKPAAATVRNDKGMLPIEVSTRNVMYGMNYEISSPTLMYLFYVHRLPACK